MAKRIQTAKFLQLLKLKFGKTVAQTKPSIQEVAADNGVTVPKDFWDNYKVRRGIWGFESKNIDESVNEEVIDDDLFTIDVTTTELLKHVTLTLKVNGRTAKTSMAPTNDPTKFITHYKQQLKKDYDYSQKPVDKE